MQHLCTCALAARRLSIRLDIVPAPRQAVCVGLCVCVCSQCTQVCVCACLCMLLCGWKWRALFVAMKPSACLTRRWCSCCALLPSGGPLESHCLQGPVTRGLSPFAVETSAGDAWVGPMHGLSLDHLEQASANFPVEPPSASSPLTSSPSIPAWGRACTSSCIIIIIMTAVLKAVAFVCCDPNTVNDTHRQKLQEESAP